MDANKEWNVKYWSDQLNEISEKVVPIRQKLFEIPSTPLTCEEQIRLRGLLMNYTAITELLKRDLAVPDPTPLPFYKKLFRKS